jgi:Holliday junction resolvase RusA-like endonuclease
MTLRKIINLLPGISLNSQHEDLPKLQGPLHLYVNFYMQPSKSLTLKKKCNLYGTYHIFKPDLSNLIKFLEDVCCGIILHDDCVIAAVTSKKIYDSIPRTEFYFEEIK